MTDILRNTTVEKLFDTLAEQHARKVDVVLPATALTARNGQIEVATGAEPVLSEYGITSIDGRYAPADTFIDHLSKKLGIPLDYLRRMAATRPDMFDANVNGWLQGDTVAAWTSSGRHGIPSAISQVRADTRSFLFRGFSGDNEHPQPQARGLLSDKFKIVDNLDGITAVLQGIRDAGMGDIQVSGADLTDRHMFVRFVAPQVEVAAQALVEGYRSPFEHGAERAGNAGYAFEAARRLAAKGLSPVLWAGFEFSNSELGYGRYALTPRAELLVCGNGQKITTDVEAATHLGKRMEEGRIDWSTDTREAELQLIRLRTRDTVQRFLSAEYWQEKVAELAAKAGRPVRDAEKTVTVVSKSLGFSDAERKTILDHFILGGQLTSGGVFNAVTSAAQTVQDAERAADMESQAVKALDLAAQAG